VFLSRGLVQRYLYDSDLTGWLAVARLGMGYPLTIAALAISVLAVRRVRRAVRDRETPADLSGPARAADVATGVAEQELAERPTGPPGR